MLKVFDLTLVLYDSQQPLLTLSLGLFALSPFMVLVGLCTLLLTSRHTRTWFHVSLLSGLCVSHLMNSALKRLIKGPRPVNPWLEDLASKQCFAYGNVSSVGYGMPSAHAQFMFFLCAFIFFSRVMLRGERTGADSGGDGGSGVKGVHKQRRSKALLWRWISFDPIIVLWSVLVCVSRVFHLYHTTQQVMLGAVVGSVLGVMWSLVTMYPRMASTVPMVARLRRTLCQWFDIRLTDTREANSDCIHHCIHNSTDSTDSDNKTKKKPE